MIHRALLLITLAFASLTGAARADDDLLTDRPDFTETTLAMSPRRLQLEGGFTLADLGGAPSVWNAPEALLRVGVLRGAELRFGMDYLWQEGRFSSGEVVDGYAGAKLQLMSGGSFGLALIPAITVPVWGEDDVDPELVVAWSQELPSPWAVGGIVGYTWEDGSGENVLTGTISLGAPIGQRFGTFLEYALEATDDQLATLIHHGYTLGLAPDVQLDLHGGLGLNADAPDFFIGAGLALRR